MNQIIFNLTDSDFEELLLQSTHEHNNLFLVDFWAEWCNPCKMLVPILESIAIELHGTLQVVKVNVDSNPIITKKYKIKSIPTLLLILNGVVVDTKIGLVSKKQIIDFINPYL